MILGEVQEEFERRKPIFTAIAAKKADANSRRCNFRRGTAIGEIGGPEEAVKQANEHFSAQYEL